MRPSRHSTEGDGCTCKVARDAETVAELAARSRAKVSRRSTIPDHAIDPLADWIEAEDAPAFMAEARAHAEDGHRRGLDSLRDAGLFAVRRL